MICRYCLTGYGMCVSWADDYKEIAASRRGLEDRHWQGIGDFWITVDPHNGVEVHHAQIKDDITASAVVCAIHLANQERVKMLAEGDHYKPPVQRRINPIQEMMRQRDLLR